MEVLRKINLPKKYELRMRRDVNIGIGHLSNSNEEQVPGYLSVKVDNYNLDYNQVEFFGVDKKGKEVSGKGVLPSHIGSSQTGEVILLFNISRLTESRQFTDETVEGVITLSGQEIGRDQIESNPSIYLG
ncbi:hypothetical protein BX659_12072 [Orenia metallireducens]|uniref:Uncharacterized protein n=1 Tax=Orenia metallireducens TaxID=1413210 RepID=A0A285H037_9FIRM|nr:hypothetical protein [Orenia metallireducens]PRX26481.1 hypothetical protein BX659_12072 [Orenia metallireducens]SNY28904.1 hypothetical protein SAMN06265827_11272 [Orenia metallireducens]